MYSIEQLKRKLLSMNKYLGTCIFNGEKKKKTQSLENYDYHSSYLLRTRAVYMWHNHLIYLFNKICSRYWCQGFSDKPKWKWTLYFPFFIWENWVSVISGLARTGTQSSELNIQCVQVSTHYHRRHRLEKNKIKIYYKHHFSLQW